MDCVIVPRALCSIEVGSKDLRGLLLGNYCVRKHVTTSLFCQYLNTDCWPDVAAMLRSHLRRALANIEQCCSALCINLIYFVTYRKNKTNVVSVCTKM